MDARQKLKEIAGQRPRKAENRLLTRAAQKRDYVIADTYRAATVRERSPARLFQHPARAYWETADARLLEYFSDREPWLLQADAYALRVISYPAAAGRSKPAISRAIGQP